MMPNTNSIHSSSSHNNNTTPPSSPTPAAPKNTVSKLSQQQQRSPTKSPFSKRLVLPRFLAPRKHRQQQQQQQQDKKKKEQPISSKDEQSKSSSSKSSHKSKRTSRGTPSKDSGGLPVFTITYCQNSSSNNSNNNKSGGAGTPELRSAQSCVRSIFPECEIIERPVQRIPIRLTVTAELDGPPSYKIWQGQQQNLSRNDVPTRTLTMREMTAKLEQFRYNVGMTT